MHPNKLVKIIKEKIEREGPISFETFMDIALYHPELGYYASPAARWGPAGDYYTSARLHPWFGRLLAVQLDEMRERLDRPDPFTVVEVGGGEGHLAADVIACIERHLRWQSRWRYLLIEKNPAAANRQRSLLGDAARRVAWKSSLEEIAPVTGCILSNELLDAFPVHRVCMQDRFQEVHVGLANERFVEVFGDLSRPELADYIAAYRIPPIAGYRTEINLRIKPFLQAAQQALRKGYVLTIDYGFSARQYYAPERSQGTLTCYHRHKAGRDPYGRIGSQDITAHVNFTSLKDWGEAGGLRALGYCSQGAFLASIAAAAETAAGAGIDPAAISLTDRLKLKNLLLDLGATHQVMVQYKGPRELGKLTGFAVSNRLRSL